MKNEMTNEEMVYYLEHADITVGQKCKTKTAEAIEKALKIIESQPCEDCVKREDVKSGMIKYGFLAPDMTVTEFVEDLPSVTPTRSHGHWIERELYGYGKDPFERNKIIICSECNASHRIIDNDLKWFEFCPKCGAIMDENFVMMRYKEENNQND